jgi:hypothetical protein
MSLQHVSGFNFFFRSFFKMSQTATSTELLNLVGKLQAERADHVQAIEAIDSTFQQLGMNVASMPAQPRRGRPAKINEPSVKPAMRGRGKYALTGDESVLAFVQANPECTTAQVNEHWIKEGRSGMASNTLAKLAKAGKVTRKNLKGQRGSTFTAR